MIRLLIADDHAIVRSGLKQIFALSPGIEVVAEAVSGDEVLSTLQRVTCDLLLLDLNMPGISGPDLIHRVKAHNKGQRILVLSMHNAAQVAARVLKAGADGYITKDSEPEVLIAAIRKVAAGGRFVASEVAQNMALDATAGEESLHSTLSDREHEVFRLLVGGKSVNEIADELSISNKTVSTHKMRLMEKLQASSMADLMRYAMEHKLLD